MNFKKFILAGLCLIVNIIYVQSQQQFIKLLDSENNNPIVGATYIYGDQQGISNENGEVFFNYQAGTEMTLSHITYGTLFLNEKTLLEAIDKKVYYCVSTTNNLFPVTVIGLRNLDKQPQDQLKIDYQDRMAHDAATILNQVPAFNSIRKSGNYGFDPVFRGFTNDQLNIVLNGAQSATAACPNRMDPPSSQMAPNMIDRIEILKGPHALRYGVGLGATINFIPAKLRFTEQSDFYGRVSTGYENNGNIRRGEAQTGFSGKAYDISVFAAWSQGDDYEAGNGETVQADFKRGSYGTNLGFKLTDYQELRISAMYNRARDADFPALAMDLRKDDTWMFSARHDAQITKEKLKSWNTTLFGSFVDHVMNNLLKPLDPRMLNAETVAKTYNFGGRTEGNWLFNNSKLFAGADLRVEGAKGTRVREFLMGPNAGNIVEDNAWQDGSISKTGVFAEYQIKGKLFNYILSGRLEVNHSQLNDPAPEFVQVNSDLSVTQVNPSFSIGVLKDLSKSTKISLWLARAQRSGNLTERYINYFTVGQDPFEMIGNPQLSPEVNNQIDLTFEWNINERSAINLDLFTAYLQDFISSVIDPDLDPRLPSSPGVRRFVNIEDAFKSGFEVNWVQELAAGLNHRMGIAYTYAQDLERDEPLPQIAPLDFRYALYGSYFKNRFNPELVFRYVSEQSRISNEFGETATPSFALLDFKAGYQINDNLNFNIGVNNIFDENYFEHLNRSVRGTNNPIFASGRNVFVNLNYNF
jgi:iron complex outermembrane receptor protein